MNKARQLTATISMIFSHITLLDTIGIWLIRYINSLAAGSPKKHIAGNAATSHMVARNARKMDFHIIFYSRLYADRTAG